MRENQNGIYVSGFFDITSPENSVCNHWEMLYVKSGKVCVTAESQVFELNEGDVIFFEPNSFHYIKDVSSADYIFLAFDADGDYLSEFSNSAFKINESEINLLIELYNTKNSDGDDLSEQQTYLMLELFMIYCLKNGVRLSPLKQKNAALFSKAAEILLKNINSQISVPYLATKLGISLSNLKRLFNCYTNIGVHEYHTVLRISKAKELLQNGETVTSTSELTGFANQAYFSAAFKHIVGISPKEYSMNLHRVSNRKRTIKQKREQTEDLPSYLL